MLCRRKNTWDTSIIFLSRQVMFKLLIKVKSSKKDYYIYIWYNYNIIITIILSTKTVFSAKGPSLFKSQCQRMFFYLRYQSTLKAAATKDVRKECRSRNSAESLNKNIFINKCLGFKIKVSARLHRRHFYNTAIPTTAFRALTEVQRNRRFCSRLDVSER